MDQQNDEQLQKPLEFDEFVGTLAPDEPVEEEAKGKSVHCDYCDWKSNPKGKDHKRAIRGHIRTKHPAEFEELYGKKKSQVVNVEFLPPVVESVMEVMEPLNEDEMREKLLCDLDLLQAKFPSIPFNWDYSSSSSITQLKRKKNLFMRILNDSAGTEAVFKLLTIGCVGAERVTRSLGVADIDGYARDISNQREDIMPILKNLVDPGQLDIGHLSAEVRLIMIMGSTALERMEKNRILHNGSLNEKEDAEFV